MYDPNKIFTIDEIRQLRRFAMSISNSMIPLQYKDWYYLDSGQIWDIDTYCAEAARCLAMSEKDFSNYFELKKNDDNRIGNLDLFLKICYEYKVNSFVKLQSICHEASEIIVCEAGRGIDVLLTSFVKPWHRIVAYDQDKSVLYEMKKYFKGELGLPFEVQQINTINYDFSGINERTIIFGTVHNVNADKKKEILGNTNLIGLLDGEVIS
jgi:hypothetical protein